MQNYAAEENEENCLNFQFFQLKNDNIFLINA